MLNAAIIGWGGISKAHRRGYEILEQEGKVRLVAACDIDPKAFNSNTVTNMDSDEATTHENVHFYTELDEMLQNEKLDYVDICTPTFCHKELAVKLLKKGYHVISEKPMALCWDDCKEMVDTAEAAGKHLMIAQCVRFFKEYEFLKACVDDNRYGKVISAYFSRLSIPPIWGTNNWFMDYSKSGGAITDFHVHDIDFIRYLFGEPEAVSCRAAHDLSLYDAVHSVLTYGDVPVTAVGDWSLTGMQFVASYRVGFEKATIVYDGEKVTVYPKDGSEIFSPELQGHDGYTAEISYFCDVVAGKIENTKNPAISAAKSIRLIEKLKESAENKGCTVCICE